MESKSFDRGAFPAAGAAEVDDVAVDALPVELTDDE
jgi:hypothetical protein